MDAQKLATVMKLETKNAGVLKSPLGELPASRVALLGDQAKATSAMTGAAIAAAASRDFSAKFAPIVRAHEKTTIAQLQKMVVDSAAPQSVIKGLSSGVIDSMLKSIERDFVRPSHLVADLGSFINASEIIRSSLGLVSGFKAFPDRPTAPPSRTPVHLRLEVRRFLERRHPRLLKKLDGIYEARDLSDGVSQSANSAAELLKLLTFSLVPYADVQEYARRTYKSKPQKHHAMELIAVVYSVDATILMMLSNANSLPASFHDLKHDEWTMDEAVARAELDHLVDQLEDLLVFLAQSIDR